MNIPSGRLTKSWGTSNVLVVALLTLCSPVIRSEARGHSPGPAAESRPMAPGLWGGNHLRMTVSRIGARLEYDCADSTIDQPIIPDARGRFTAKGSYTPAHGGPRRNGEAAAGRARYVGEVRADTMRLTGTLENTKQPVGGFRLRRGDD